MFREKSDKKRFNWWDLSKDIHDIAKNSLISVTLLIAAVKVNYLNMSCINYPNIGCLPKDAVVNLLNIVAFIFMMLNGLAIAYKWVIPKLEKYLGEINPYESAIYPVLTIIKKVFHFIVGGVAGSAIVIPLFLAVWTLVEVSSRTVKG